MAKTGTTSLGRCLEILGFVPHVGFHAGMKQVVRGGGDIEPVLAYASGFRSFEDSPWYLLYRELDLRFPGSKFVLTVRRDALTHARSAWTHAVRRGLRTGSPAETVLQSRADAYASHNRDVLEYFKNRPDDLLVVCWEDGDGWQKLCAFLGVSVPQFPLPHCNPAQHHRLRERVLGSGRYAGLVRRLRGVRVKHE